MSAALKTTVVAASTTEYRLPEPALCAFQTAADPGLSVQIYAFPFTTGRNKGWSLAKFQDDLRAGAGESASMGLTYRITEHPEWGTDAFTLLEYNSGQAQGAQVWTPKYSSAFDDGSGRLSDAAYLADATDLGDALVRASK